MSSCHLSHSPKPQLNRCPPPAVGPSGGGRCLVFVIIAVADLTRLDWVMGLALVTGHDGYFCKVLLETRERKFKQSACTTRHSSPFIGQRCQADSLVDRPILCVFL